MPALTAAAPLAREDLPPIYHATSAYSRRGQDAATRWLAVQLLLLSAGAVLGAVDARTGDHVNLGALAAAAALLLSLVPAGWVAWRDPQRRWYTGRVAAESIKSIAWKYAVRAAPFDADDPAGRARLAADLAAIRRDLPGVPWPATTGDQVTPAMAALRDHDLPGRRHAYVAGRIEAELHWYRARARKFTGHGRRWMFAAIAATVVGLAGGFVKAFGLASYDGLGAASAIAAAATAWLQMKQFRPLAAAYELTAAELAVVEAQAAEVTDEARWADWAACAEDAISREHTMWLARRQTV